MIDDKFATIEILFDEEIGAGTVVGRYMVREYDKGDEVGIEYFDSILVAEKHVINYQGV